MSRHGLLTALRYPHKRAALPYIMRQPSLLMGMARSKADAYYAKAVRGFFGAPLSHSWRDALPEQFRQYVQSNPEVDHDGWRMLLYLLVRKHRPKVFIETGVSRGASSAFILAAMKENGVGRLYSIDLPPTQAAVAKDDATNRTFLSDGQHFDPQGIGDYVPEFLKDRWELVLGDARKELPALLSRLGSIDIFFHDSLHTYDHMKFEFDASWPALVPGGWMISHDVIWNQAWQELANKAGVKPYVYHSLSMFQRPSAAPTR
jgi:predicted O-methyltransferase YrrM